MLTHDEMIWLRHEATIAAGQAGPRTPDDLCRAGWLLPEAVTEAVEARSAMDGLCAEYARLIAAARAAVAAAESGDPDAAGYVRAELDRHFGLPPDGATAMAMLGDAAGAMRITRRVAAKWKQ